MKKSTQEPMSTKINKRQKKTTHLPFDLALNILSRFSFRFLSRFKCVCKDWNSWIQDLIIPQFKFHRFIIARRQVQKHYNGQAEFYFIDKDGSAANYFGQFTKNRPVQKIVSCNGLLCFTSNDGILRLCNPTRKETAILPKPNFLRRKINFKNICIGFGFDSTVQRYKIVVWNTVDKPELEIITLGTKSCWRPIKIPPNLHLFSYCRRSYSTCSPIYIDGVSHWCGASNLFSSGDNILSFNFSKEEFQVSPIPRHIPDVSDLHEIRGRLCIVEKEMYDSLLIMWVLKDYDKGLWFKEEIQLQSNITNRVMTVRGSEILIQTEEKETKELVIYRCNDQNQVIASIKVQELPFTPNHECTYQFYRESLVGVKSLTDGCRE